MHGEADDHVSMNLNVGTVPTTAHGSIGVGKADCHDLLITRVPGERCATTARGEHVYHVPCLHNTTLIIQEGGYNIKVLGQSCANFLSAFQP